MAISLMKQKYTIIYGEVIRRANLHSTLIKFDRVECEPSELSKLIDDDKYCGGVEFIFHGWPQQEGEHPQREIVSAGDQRHDAECPIALGVAQNCICGQ